MSERARGTVSEKLDGKSKKAARDRIEQGFTSPTVRPYSLIGATRATGGTLRKSIRVETGYGVVNDKAGFTGTAEFSAMRQSRVSGTAVGIDLGYYYNEAINPFASIHPQWNFGASAGIYSEGGAINASYQPYAGPNISIVSTSGIGFSLAKGYDDLASGKLKPQLMLVPGPVSDPIILAQAATGSLSYTFAGVYSVAKAIVDPGYSLVSRFIEWAFPSIKRMRRRRDYAEQEKLVDGGKATVEQCALLIQSKPQEWAAKAAASMPAGEAMAQIMEQQLSKAGAKGKALVAEWKKKAGELSPLALLEGASKLSLPGFDIAPVEQMASAVLRQSAATQLMARFYQDANSGEPSLKLAEVERLYKFVSRNQEIFSPHFLADLEFCMDSRRWSSGSRTTFDFVNRLGTKGVGGQIGAAALSSILSVQELTLDVPLIFRDPLSVPSRLVEGLYTFEDTKKAHGFFGKALAFMGDLFGGTLTLLTRAVMAFSPIQFRSDARKEKVRANLKNAMKENDRLLSQAVPDWSDKQLIKNTLYLNGMLPALDNSSGRPLKAKIEKHMAGHELAYELLTAKATRLAAQECESQGDLRQLAGHLKRLTEIYLYLNMLPGGRAGKLSPEVQSEIEAISTLFSEVGDKYKDVQAISNLCINASMALSNMQDLSSGKSTIKPQLDTFFYWLIKSGGSVPLMLSDEKSDKELSEAIGTAKSTFTSSALFRVYHDYFAQSLAASPETAEGARKALAKAYDESTAMVRQLRLDIERGASTEDLRGRLFDLSNQLYFTSLLANSLPEVADGKANKMAYALGDEVDKLLDGTPPKIRKGMPYPAKEKALQRVGVAYMVVSQGLLMQDDAERQGERLGKRIEKDESYRWQAEMSVEFERKIIFECRADAKSLSSAAKEYFKDDPEMANFLSMPEIIKQIKDLDAIGKSLGKGKYVVRISGKKIEVLERPESQSFF